MVEENIHHFLFRLFHLNCITMVIFSIIKSNDINKNWSKKKIWQKIIY